VLGQATAFHDLGEDTVSRGQEVHTWMRVSTRNRRRSPGRHDEARVRCPSEAHRKKQEAMVGGILATSQESSSNAAWEIKKRYGNIKRHEAVGCGERIHRVNETK